MGVWSGRSTVAYLSNHCPHTHAGRLHGRSRQAGHEFASQIGREKREQIRRLVQLGLTIKRNTKQASTARDHRAIQLASQAIDKMGDPTVHPDEHAHRRRRLTKGPEEFRELRVDRPKTKGS